MQNLTGGEKIKKNILFLLTVSLSLISSAGFAEILKAGLENQHSVRFAARSDEEEYDFYLTRVSGWVDYHFARIDRAIKFSPFFEYQTNLDLNTWWRKEAGLEAGTSFFGDIFYYGASFQYIWQKEENYAIEALEQTGEWESRFVITPPIPWGIFKDRVKLHLLDEYTYDFKRGQPTFNDVAIVLEWLVSEHLRIPIGWRHTDRVHDFDSDLIEFSVIFSY